MLVDEQVAVHRLDGVIPQHHRRGGEAEQTTNNAVGSGLLLAGLGLLARQSILEEECDRVGQQPQAAGEGKPGTREPLCQGNSLHQLHRFSDREKNGFARMRPIVQSLSVAERVNKQNRLEVQFDPKQRDNDEKDEPLAALVGRLLESQANEHEIYGARQPDVLHLC